jgi:hypothetical protein
MVVRGQVSRTAIYESHERFAEKIEEGKSCYLYYAGDFDPSGLSIYHSLVERLQKYDGIMQYMDYKRIALTPEQIEEYELPSDPGKQSDPNYKRFVAEYGDNVVELDALPPDVLRNIVEGCIQRHIDRELLEQMRKTELMERARLREFVESF